MAVLAGLGKTARPSSRSGLAAGAWRLGAAVRTRRLVIVNQLRHVFGRAADDAPDLLDPLVERLVVEIPQIRHQIGRQVVGGHLAAADGLEQFGGIGRPAGRASPGRRGARQAVSSPIDGQDRGRRLLRRRTRPGREGRRRAVRRFAVERPSASSVRRQLAGALRVTSDLNRLRRLFDRGTSRRESVPASDSAASASPKVTARAESCIDQRRRSRIFPMASSAAIAASPPGIFTSRRPLSDSFMPRRNVSRVASSLAFFRPSSKQGQRLLRIARADAADHVVLEDRNVLAGRHRQRQSPRRIDLRQRLHRVPVHQRQVVVGGVFGVAGQALRESFQRDSSGKPLQRRWQSPAARLASRSAAASCFRLVDHSSCSRRRSIDSSSNAHTLVARISASMPDPAVIVDARRPECLPLVDPSTLLVMCACSKANAACTAKRFDPLCDRQSASSEHCVQVAKARRGRIAAGCPLLQNSLRMAHVPLVVVLQQLRPARSFAVLLQIHLHRLGVVVDDPVNPPVAAVVAVGFAVVAGLLSYQSIM